MSIEGTRCSILLALFAVTSSTGCATVGRAAFRAAATSSTNTHVSAGLTGTTMESQDPRLAGALLNVLLYRSPERLAAAALRYYQLGVGDAAMDYYAASLALNGRYAPALDGAARIRRDWGQMGAALGSAYRATYFAPGSAEAWNTLGTIMQGIGRDDSAAAAYRRALALEPSAPYARNNLCYLAFLHGDGPQALAECSAALTSDPQFVPARNNLALAYAASGNEARALDEFSAAGGEAVGHYNAGIVMLAERRYSAAVLAFEAAYHAQPQFDRAHARARDARRLTRAHTDAVHADR